MGTISIRLTTPWCFASMRRAEFRFSSEPSPCFRSGSLFRVRHSRPSSVDRTTTLFAVSDGQSSLSATRHCRKEFLTFLRHTEDNMPPQLDIHLVVDKYATHKHPKVTAWLACWPRSVRIASRPIRSVPRADFS